MAGEVGFGQVVFEVVFIPINVYSSSDWSSSVGGSSRFWCLCSMLRPIKIRSRISSTSTWLRWLPLHLHVAISSTSTWLRWLLLPPARGYLFHLHVATVATSSTCTWLSLPHARGHRLSGSRLRYLPSGCASCSNEGPYFTFSSCGALQPPGH